MNDQSLLELNTLINEHLAHFRNFQTNFTLTTMKGAKEVLFRFLSKREKRWLALRDCDGF